MQIYCLKCKEKVEVKSPKRMTNERGVDYALGKCPGCGGKVSVILGRTAVSSTRKIKSNASSVLYDRVVLLEKIARSILNDENLKITEQQICWLRGFLEGQQQALNYDINDSIGDHPDYVRLAKERRDSLRRMMLRLSRMQSRLVVGAKKKAGK